MGFNKYWCESGPPHAVDATNQLLLMFQVRRHENSHLHSYSAPTIIAHENAGPPNQSSPSVSDDCPPAMWQKIVCAMYHFSS